VVSHRNERGAAVFIVVMVMTLLTALGIFAVRSASLADVAAGYDREGAQAALVAEYAVTSTATYLSNAGNATFVLRRHDEVAANTGSSLLPQCQSNALLTTIPAGTRAPGCALIDSGEIQASVTRNGEYLFAPPNLSSSGTGATSSLNVNETTNAAFVVEVTEAAETGQASPGGGSFVSMTVTAMAQVRPAAPCAATNTAPAAGQQAMRAIVATTKVTP